MDFELGVLLWLIVSCWCLLGFWFFKLLFMGRLFGWVRFVFISWEVIDWFVIDLEFFWILFELDIKFVMILGCSVLNLSDFWVVVFLKLRLRLSLLSLFSLLLFVLVLSVMMLFVCFGMKISVNRSNSVRCDSMLIKEVEI